MFVMGVDGCRAGWLGIQLASKRQWEVGVFPSFADLWEKHRAATLILVDMPIGLQEAGPGARRCDAQARKILGPRKSSVFPAPCRAAVYQPDYDSAIKENLLRTGKSIFRALWQIAPKIREVDELLQANTAARKSLRESHPEVCFWALNRGRPMAHNKKTAAGAAERQKVLEEVLSPTMFQIEQLLAAGSSFKKREVAPDDFLDALALAATAWLGVARGLSTLPPDPERDERGLPMEMVYVKGSTR
jgi:predicted RNase H-like nuclease